MKDKKLYYEIFSEFYKVNKYREMKCIRHHGTDRLSHINRVGKLSFIISKKMGCDYLSCTRGALLHDFFTLDDLKTSKRSKNLKLHPSYAYNNSTNYFKINEIETDIILHHMFPITRKCPMCREAKIVSICDKIVAIYEFFRFNLRIKFNN